MKDNQAGVFTPKGRKVWPHEQRVANILAAAGHYVEFLPEATLKTPDIRIDNATEYEIKSPENARNITIERAIKKALKQCPNIIIDASRMKGAKDIRTQNFLVFQAKSRHQIKRILFITKQGKVIDISSLI